MFYEAAMPFQVPNHFVHENIRESTTSCFISDTVGGTTPSTDEYINLNLQSVTT
jgi:hypothetical protein